MWLTAIWNTVSILSEALHKMHEWILQNPNDAQQSVWQQKTSCCSPSSTPECYLFLKASAWVSKMLKMYENSHRIINEG